MEGSCGSSRSLKARGSLVLLWVKFGLGLDPLDARVMAWLTLVEAGLDNQGHKAYRMKVMYRSIIKRYCP